MNIHIHISNAWFPYNQRMKASIYMFLFLTLCSCLYGLLLVVWQEIYNKIRVEMLPLICFDLIDGI